MPNMLVPFSQHNNNHIQLSSFISHNQYFHQLLRWSVLLSSSHYLGETTIRIDSYLAGELFLTHTHTPPIGVVLGHLWYNSSSIAGKTSTASSKILPIYQGARDSNPPLGLCHWLSTHPYCLQGAHFNCSCPRTELTYLASWSERLI